MNRARVVLLLVAVTCIAALSWFPITDQDVDFHLAAGREIAAHHRVPQTNVFGYTLPDAPWGSHQWLGSLLIYGAYRLGEVTRIGGAEGLTAAKCAIVLVLFFLLYGVLKRETWPGGFRFGRGPWDDTIAAGILVLAVWSARPRLIERPLLLSALLEGVLLWFLANYEQRPARRLLWIIPLFVIWWNLHAGYIYGLLILGAFVTGDALEGSRRRAAGGLAVAGALAVACAILVALPLNPGSLRGLLFPLQMFRSSTFSLVIDEFHRTTPGTNPAFSVLFVITILAVALATWRGRRPRMAHLFLLAGFAVLAIARVRMILDFSVVAAPIVAGTLASIAPRRVPRWLPASRVPVAAAMLLAVIIPWRVARGEAIRFGHGLDPRIRPFAAYDFVERQRLPNHVLVTDIWSGSFLWRFYPERRVFVHNQLEVYDENFAQNIYLPFLRAEDGWQGMLDEAGVNVLLMRYSGARFDQRITRAAFEDPRWKLVYWDDIAMILVRDTPANAEVIGTDPFRVVNPDSPDPGLLVASGMGEAAQAEILRVVTRDPACRRAWNMLGDLRLYMGRFAESEEAYRRLEALAAHKHERALAIAGRARAGLAVGRAADALALCDRALVMSPRDMSIKTLRAQALLATGRAEEAKREARELARSKGTASADLISLAQTLVVTGDHELAGSLFATAAAHAGDGVDRGRVLFATATTWEQAGALPLAEDAYRRAMAADPANPEAVKGLAWLLGRQGRNAEALELARRAVTLGSNDGAAWGTLGLAMLTAGHPDSAVVAFERSRELLAVYAANPGYRQALGNTLLGLAWAYEATGHPVQSARALAEARELGITTEGAGHTGPAAGPPDGAPGKSGY